MCGAALALWHGVIGTLQVGVSPTPIACCLLVQPVDLPPPDRPVDLVVGGHCTYPALPRQKHKRRRACRPAGFNERTSLDGMDRNGAIGFALCQNYETATD